MTDLPTIPKVTLGRSGLVSTRLGLGCAGWPLRSTYEQVLQVLQAAFALGMRHIDLAPFYLTEELFGRALKEVTMPSDTILATKVCAYRDELGLVYREYSARTVYRSVERSLKWLQVDHLPIVQIHDCEPPDLPQLLGKEGALAALMDLKRQGVVGSIGMATFSRECLWAAIACGEVDHIQSYHTYTLLNQEGKQQVFLPARVKNLSVLNNAPYAGWILQTGAGPEAMYNYKAASPAVMAATQRLEEVCARKGVALATAALAFSVLDPEIDVTVIGASSPERLRERVKALAAPLTNLDFQEMLAAAGESFPTSSPWSVNPINAFG